LNFLASWGFSRTLPLFALVADAVGAGLAPPLLPLNAALQIATRTSLVNKIRTPPGGVACVANKGLETPRFWKCGKERTYEAIFRMCGKERS